jgi:hypothetical protein
MTRAIPKPGDPSALALYEGHVLIGTIVAKDGAFYAYDIHSTLIGVFTTQAEAVRAIPALSCSTTE